MPSQMRSRRWSTSSRAGAARPRQGFEGRQNGGDLLRVGRSAPVVDAAARVCGLVDHAAVARRERIVVVGSVGDLTFEFVAQATVAFREAQDSRDQGVRRLRKQMVTKPGHAVDRGRLACRKYGGDHVLAESGVLERAAFAATADVARPHHHLDPVGFCALNNGHRPVGACREQVDAALLMIREAARIGCVAGGAAQDLGGNRRKGTAHKAMKSQARPARKEPTRPWSRLAESLKNAA